MDRDDEMTDATAVVGTPTKSPTAEPQPKSDQPLAGLLVAAGWPSQITDVVVPHPAHQRDGLRQFLCSDSLELAPCGFGVWLCAAAGAGQNKRNFVAGPLAALMQSAFHGEVHGPAIFLGGPRKGSGQLTALNDAQRALIYRAYTMVVTQHMERAEEDLAFREGLNAGGY